jgi:hypothetical protein
VTFRTILLSTIAAVVVSGLAGPSRLEAAPDGASRLVLKNGTVFILKEPPRISGTRVVFTTIEGNVLSLDESEVASIGAAPAPPPATKKYDQEDSRNLGAIAAQQRDARGKRAEVAPRAPSQKKTPTP